jgi:hypothetical protein
VFLQPVAATQVSTVQTFPSLQFGGGPPTQFPPEQTSLVVHALPSSHAMVFDTCTQPVVGAHESSVHTLESLQFRTPVGWQSPVAQASPVVQALPSLQDVPSVFVGFEHTPVVVSHVPTAWH